MAVLLKFLVQKQFRSITATWEVWAKPICIADCMELPRNKKNGGIESYSALSIIQYVMHLLYTRS